MIFLVACGKKDELDDSKITLYYPIRDGIGLEGVEYQFTATDRGNRLDEAVAMLSITDNARLEPAIGAGIVLTEAYVDEEQNACLYFNEGYNSIEASKELVIRASLVRTVTQISGINSVSIFVNEQPLLDANGNSVDKMYSDSFIIGGEMLSDQINETRVVLYFSGKDGNDLVKVERDIIIDSSLEESVLQCLIEGPLEDEGYAVINPKTTIKSINIASGVCYIDLSSEFMTQPYNVSSDVGLYSIVNTMTELKNISSVVFKVEGSSDVNYQEKYSFNEKFTKREDIVSQ